ncbi:MAG TPA: hypothetical protein DCP37_03975 [Dehalococcoidia bacterium]|nr:hypothetical protein [SAR202 cluster bacterium]MDP6664423.1 hypothetical protein [SAR202 cluster bacterium]MDP6799991.1 hypothetical protein [SAR202 cluster bacterium]HAL46889.1 hypothetical protein [Dehalococcoidia bacterium]
MTREVNKLPGIIEVAFDQTSKVATVAFDSAKVSEEAVRKAIEGANLEIAAENAPRPDIGGILGSETAGEN